MRRGGRRRSSWFSRCRRRSRDRNETRTASIRIARKSAPFVDEGQPVLLADVALFRHEEVDGVLVDKECGKGSVAFEVKPGNRIEIDGG